MIVKMSWQRSHRATEEQNEQRSQSRIQRIIARLQRSSTMPVRSRPRRGRRGRQRSSLRIRSSNNGNAAGSHAAEGWLCTCSCDSHKIPLVESVRRGLLVHHRFDQVFSRGRISDSNGCGCVLHNEDLIRAQVPLSLLIHC